MKEPFDVIIVGQGIAGSVLALTFLENGKRVLVLNKDQPVTSSKVAAGLYNPITGRKPTLTWNAALFFPYLLAFYKRWQEKLEVKFLHEMPVFRPATDTESMNDMTALTAKEGYAHFMQIDHLPVLDPIVKSKNEGCSTKYSGYLHTECFLKTVQKYLNESGILIEKEIQSKEDVQFESEWVKCHNYKARYLVFCEGYHMRDNHFFRYLPLKPNKGQIEDIYSKELPKDIILNKGVFVVPTGDGTSRVGATYAWDFDDEQPELKARAKNEEQLNKLVKINYTHHQSRSGIRPATSDRKPLIGTHPQYPLIGVFNGMGSKGVSMAPYLAHHFYRHLVHGDALMPEVSINRFKSLCPK